MKLPGKVLKYFKPAAPVSFHEPLLSSDDDLEESFGHFALQKKDNALLLNRIKAESIIALMQKVGLTERLQALGFGNLQVEIRRDEAQSNHLKIYFDEAVREKLLINLRLSRSRFRPDRRFFENVGGPPLLDMVMIEWLSAEDPRKDFSAERPQLPGQRKPGLGCLRYLIELLHIIGRLLMIDGFLDLPNHFHGAVIYSRKFKFFDPCQEAALKAILRDLQRYTLEELSWGMITGSIIDRQTGRPYIYVPSEQLFPVSRYLNRYFNSRRYRKAFANAYRSGSYHLDYEAMLERKEKALQEKNIEEL